MNTHNICFVEKSEKIPVIFGKKCALSGAMYCIKLALWLYKKHYGYIKKHYGYIK